MGKQPIPRRSGSGDPVWTPRHVGPPSNPGPRMADTQQFILGEYSRTLDERYRLSVPSELGDLLTAESTDCILAKERAGCLSLWSRQDLADEAERGSATDSAEDAGRQARRANRPGATARTVVVDPARAGHFSRKGTTLAPRRVPRVSRRGIRRRSDGHRRRRVHRTVESTRVAQVPRSKHAAFPSLVRSTHRLSNQFHARSGNCFGHPPGLCHPVGMQVITD